MNIFKAEKSISDKISKDTTTLCYSKVDNDISDIVAAGFDIERAKTVCANQAEDSDLYFHQSILVSTTWNANDDVFMPEHVWAARKSPVNKPTNFNHNSTKIVGHIINNFAVNENIERIAEDTPVDDLPSKFHILTGAVIYKVWHSDAEYEQQVAELIEECERGEMFVSMECKFNDFSYALQDNAGRLSIVSRNPETAFLSLSLRRYGGDGFYKGNRIGRVLKGINFIGKGYTKDPANEESVVFRSNNIFSFSNIQFAEKFQEIEEGGVLLNSKQEINGDLRMSEPNNDKLVDLTSRNTELLAEVDRLKSELSKADVKKHEEKLAEAVEQNKLVSATLESTKQDLESVNAKLAESQSEVEAAKAKLDEVEKAKSDLEGEMAELKAAQVLAQRVSKLVSAGYSDLDAEAKAAIFKNLNDEQFDTILAELSRKSDEADKNTAEANKNLNLDELESDEADEDVSSASYDGEDEDEQVDDVVNSFATTFASYYSTSTATCKNNKLEK